MEAGGIEDHRVVDRKRLSGLSGRKWLAGVVLVACRGWLATGTTVKSLKQLDIVVV